MSVERLSDRAIEIIDELHTERLDYTSEYLPLIDAANKLAAYEATGLEPDDLKKPFDEEALLTMTARGMGTTPDRLRELVEADRAGRCVVLPCHIGDPVFMGTGRNKITGYEEDVCDGFYVGRDGVLQVKAQNHKGNHGTYGVIGRTAELTREAAEATLKGESDGAQTDIPR